MERSWAQPFAQTFQTTREWFVDLGKRLDTDDPQKVYRALRAVLVALRDRLELTEAADLGAQLPAVLRGMFYDGFTGTTGPAFKGGRDEFLGRVEQSLEELSDPGAEECALAVFGMLEHRVTRGELQDVGEMLPAELNDLWPTDTTE